MFWGEVTTKNLPLVLFYVIAHLHIGLGQNVTPVNVPDQMG
jgi:hypothetical protein